MGISGCTHSEILEALTMFQTSPDLILSTKAGLAAAKVCGYDPSAIYEALGAEIGLTLVDPSKIADPIDTFECETESESYSYSECSGNNRVARRDDLNAEFLNEVKSLAKDLNCDYKDILAVMHAESGLNSAAVNKKSGASGLIQFMPKTAKGLGTSVEAIRNMSATEQMVYVREYMTKAKKNAGFSESDKLTAGQVYSLVFMPARAKREVLTTSDELAYQWNAPTDLNGDGKITRTEMDIRAQRHRVDESVFIA